MKWDPRPFQRVAVEHAASFLRSAKRGDRQLYAAPTGVGKSIVELLLREEFPDLWVVTPREEIIAGMLDKLGAPYDADPLDYRIATPIKLRNRLLSGAVAPPRQLLFDEGHHHNAETWQQLDLLTGCAPSVAYTASPYRGSPKGTREFLEHWGEPLWLITYEEAIAEGYIALPKFSTLPLVDDDIVEVKGGEFDVTSIESATVDRLGDLAAHAAEWCDGKWDKPTIFALPSSELCLQLQRELGARGAPSIVVSAATPRAERAIAFEAAKERIAALLHINIVTEGVDLPLRRLVDAAPTMSPVKWVQQLGRIMRPTSDPPDYICTNRNMMRHAYVLEGIVSVGALQESERSFPPTHRAHARVLGLEAIGRFKPVRVKLASGLSVHLYSLSVAVGASVVEFCSIVHPAMEPIWATKVNTKNEDGTKAWGTWRRCDPPSDLAGFSSVAPNELSEKQRRWWDRSASRYGLDPAQEVTRKSFQALPVLADIGARLQ